MLKDKIKKLFEVTFGHEHDPRNEIRDMDEYPDEFDAVGATGQIMDLVDKSDMEGLATVYKLVFGKDLHVDSNWELHQEGTGQKEVEQIQKALEGGSPTDVKLVYDELRAMGLVG